MAAVPAALAAASSSELGCVRLHHFHGGLELPRHKAQATATAIRECPLPTRLRVSLLQHAGDAASPCVQAGDSVRAGQCLGEVRDGRGANVHAPASGKVLAIESAPLASPPGLSAAHVVIAVDAGRNLAVLVEAAVRNTILQLRGIDTYQEFIERHQKAMQKPE